MGFIDPARVLLFQNYQNNHHTNMKLEIQNQFDNFPSIDIKFLNSSSILNSL